jgi:hypothetical protein
MTNTMSVASTSLACAGGCVTISTLLARQLLILNVLTVIIILIVAWQMYRCWKNRKRRRDFLQRIARKGGVRDATGGDR